MRGALDADVLWVLQRTESFAVLVIFATLFARLSLPTLPIAAKTM